MTGSQGEGFRQGRVMVSFLRLLKEGTAGHKGEAGTHKGEAGTNKGEAGTHLGCYPGC